MIRPAVASSDSADPSALIPVRMLNEFTYCPRLGYLEFVDGEWDDNLFTKQGTFGHRRVDQADRKQFAAAEDAKGRESFSDTGPTESQSDKRVRAKEAAQATPEKDSRPSVDSHFHARSVMLSSDTDGIIAKLDVLEVDGNIATPVDYKRGKAPDVEGGAYEPERVQLCAQGLILRDNGFQSDEGVLYFIASKKRVVIPFTDELIDRTRQMLAEFRETIATQEIPPPLVDSPKCPGCSLVGICLPDEVNLLQTVNDDAKGRESFSDSSVVPRAGSLNEEVAANAKAAEKDSRPCVRKLLPARDDATPLYVQEFGALIGKSGERLVVSKKKEQIAQRRLKDVSQISLFGNVSLTAPALAEVLNRGISVTHFSYGGWFRGITTGLVHNNVQLRIRQFEAAAHSDESVRISRQFISGKIRNCRTLLRRHMDKSNERRSLLNRLNDYRRQAETCENTASLLGIEGIAAKTYFDGLFSVIGEKHGFDVCGRNRRPPKDPVNAVLSFVYALLTKELTITLQAVGFDPMRGFLHQPRFGRPSLALDLAEEYRPLIADSVMLTAFNNGEVGETDFLKRAGSVVMTSAGRKSVIQAFERRMQQEVTHPIFGYRLSYRRLLELQARLLARTLSGEIEQYPPFCTR